MRNKIIKTNLKSKPNLIKKLKISYIYLNIKNEI